MKFNWGTGIVIFFTFFAACMILLVVATYRHPPQMMQQDYYALDLNYQERLDKKQNAAMLTAVPQVSLDAAGTMLEVKFPAGMTAQNGTAKCYRSTTTLDDFTTQIEDAAVVNIPAAGLAAGRWHVELDWSADSKKYYWETTFIK